MRKQVGKTLRKTFNYKKKKGVKKRNLSKKCNTRTKRPKYNKVKSRTNSKKKNTRKTKNGKRGMKGGALSGALSNAGLQFSSLFDGPIEHPDLESNCNPVVLGDEPTRFFAP